MRRRSLGLVVEELSMPDEVAAPPSELVAPPGEVAAPPSEVVIVEVSVEAVCKFTVR